MQVKFKVEDSSKKRQKFDVFITAVFAGEKGPILSHWPLARKRMFQSMHASKNFTGKAGEGYFFNMEDGTSILLWGLGKKSEYTPKVLRQQAALAFRHTNTYCRTLVVDVDSFALEGSIKVSQTAEAMVESIGMAGYRFEKYAGKEKKASKKAANSSIEVVLRSGGKAAQKKKLEACLSRALKIVECVHFCRDLVNEPPNVLNSEVYAKRIETDSKKFPRVRLKVLGRPELKQEKMGMFLSVNAGSAYGPRLVHLTYTPPQSSGKKLKHIALVGKGLTFDTGGYSLKPSNAIINMKFDMAGSATVYAAFRAAVMLELKVKVSCFLGMTDNAINDRATNPDSIVTARNGKTVEILNTDAEGRLVLGDVLDYACDQKPDAIIDAATLTGAVLVSLGKEVCGVMGNDDKLIGELKKSADTIGEYMWQLPIIEEFRKDMKADIADLKNIGGSRFAGSAKAAAFLENFVRKNIPWAHLDIAGVADSQSHLPYCPEKGASGLMVRSLVNYLASK